MAGDPLDDEQSCSDFFRRRILLNIRYWHENPAVNTTDVAVLDQEWTNLIRAIHFAFEIEQAWPLTQRLIAALSPYMERRGYWETWHHILDQAVDTARRAGDLAGAVDLSLLLARLLQRESRLKEAGTYYRQTIRLARRVGDETSEARACSNLGYLYIEQGNWWRTEVLCCHALEIFERTNNDHGRAHTENHLGFLYIRRHQWDLAQQHLERACKIWQLMEDIHGLMRGFINLGALFNYMQQPEKSVIYLNKALHQAKLAKEEIEIARIYTNLGVAYRLKNDSRRAEDYAWQAEAILRRFSDPIGLAEVQENLGLACLDQQKWKEAKQHLENALDNWRKLDNKYGEIRTLMYMIDYELARGNRSRVIKQLTELEHLINQHGTNNQNVRWQAMLEKYRRNLTGKSRGDSVAD